MYILPQVRKKQNVLKNLVYFNSLIAGLRYPTQSVLYFARDSPWLPLFFDTVLEIRQSGVYAWIERKWNFNSPEPKESCVEEKGTRVGYKGTVLLFTILGLGAIASISTAFIEMLANKIALNNRE